MRDMKSNKIVATGIIFIMVFAILLSNNANAILLGSKTRVVNCGHKYTQTQNACQDLWTNSNYTNCMNQAQRQYETCVGTPQAQQYQSPQVELGLCFLYWCLN